MGNDTNLQNDDNNREGNSEKHPLFFILIVILVIAVIAAGIYTIISNKKAEEGVSGDETASVITQTDDPEEAAPTTKNPARTTVVQGADGSTTTKNIAPDGLGISPDEEVDEGLSRWDGKEPLPADPQQAVKPTLTAPTTISPLPGVENLDIEGKGHSGTTKDLAMHFAGSAFSLCVKKDSSYSKNLNSPSVKPIVTKGFAERGFSFDKNGHSFSWEMSASDIQCNRLQSYPSIQSSSVRSKNSMVYRVKVDQRLTTKNIRGSYIKQNIVPFEGIVTMEYIGDKWLVDDFQLYGAELPALY